MSTETSPVHDHYKAETEKLHNEIKLLKERLNQAEKVIRNETDKISNSIKIDNKDKENESENNSIRYNVNKYELIERQQIKNNEEINDLKNLLLAEINVGLSASFLYKYFISFRYIYSILKSILFTEFEA